MSVLKCTICDKLISGGSYVKAAGKVCHKECFKCSHCQSRMDVNFAQCSETKLLYHPNCLSKMKENEALVKGHMCRKCGKPCFEGRVITLQNGEKYHGDCFICQDCNKPLREKYVCYGEEKIPLHEECTRKREIATAIATGNVCKACRKPCITGKIITISDNEMYHSNCFLCTTCKTPITGKYGQCNGSTAPYHLECLPGQNSQKLKNISENIRICKKCKQPCSSGTIYTTSTNDAYHSECFRCSDSKCNQPLTGSHALYGNPPLPYHIACGKELFAPRCCLCTHMMDGQFYRHPFFENEQYCLSHETRTACFACGRREPLPESRQEGFADLLDGRSLCAQCSGTIIIDSSEAVALYQSIVHFMGAELGLNIPSGMTEVPVLLVDVHTLNENRSKLGDVLGHHTSEEVQPEIAVRSSLPLTTPSTSTGEVNNPSPVPSEGLEETKTITPIPSPTVLSSIPGISSNTDSRLQMIPGAPIIRGVTLSKCAEVRHISSARLKNNTNGSGNSIVTNQLPQIYRVNQTRDVTAVLVLYGLPRDLTASILAHEAMHVWLKLNRGFPFRMPPKLEEGLCQVIAYLYLQHIEAQNNAQNSTSTSEKHTITAGRSSGQVSNNSTSTGSTKLVSSKLTHAINRPNSANKQHLTNTTNTTTGTTSSINNKTQNHNRNFNRKPILKTRKTLTQWFTQQILNDKSPIYGKGFQDAYAAVRTMGLTSVLSHIKRHQTLPNITKTTSKLPVV